jgi:ribosomal protein L11 methyltransferase
VEGIDPVSHLLEGMGINGIIVENPQDLEDLMDKKNSYDWDYIDEKVLNLKNVEPNIKFYLDPTEEGVQLLSDIRAQVLGLKEKAQDGAFGLDVDFGRLHVEDQLVDDVDWKDNWKEYFKTARVTQRLVIKPSWEFYEKEKPEDLVIEIDPGMAFGTGTHATTSLCLELLEQYLKEGMDVLDVGCGSGILSIAAALLGAEHTLGIEIDPLAVQISRENVELNQLSHMVQIQQGDLTKGIDFIADLVVANLMADLVIMLSEDVARHLKKDGMYISSGILVEKKIKGCGFEIVEILEEDEWCAIAARYKG